MKRAIFSLYIDVPEKEHFGNDLDRILPHSIKRANETRANFKKHYNSFNKLYAISSFIRYKF